MRRIWRGLGIVVGIGLFVPSCGDSDSPSGAGGSKGGSSGTRGDSGPDSSGSGGTDGSAGSSGEGGSAGTMGGGAAGSAGDSSAGSAGDGSVGDAGDGQAGDGDSESDAGVDANPCSACPTGACVDGGPDGGVCVECTSAAHCPNPKPQCDLERNVCVECLPSNDTCPTGQYCTDEKRCAKGCKNGSACASGICTAAHDCTRCISDSECSGQKVCGSGVCGNACSTGGPTDQCGTGFTCCAPRCVRTDRDVSNCTACGMACAAKQFCGRNGCADATLRNVCNLGMVTAVLDTEANDAQAAATILAGIVARCAPAPTTRSVPEVSADVLNPSTGRVVVPGGEMLVFAGGGFFQKGVGFLETQRSLPVYSAGVFPNLSFVKSADNTTIASTVYEAEGSRDIIVIEVGREESTGTLSLVAFGFHGNGTRAAAWYFVNVMLPNITNYPDAYYVYEWVDTNPDRNPDSGDTFTLKGSGS
jgi:hypothetical protein